MNVYQGPRLVLGMLLATLATVQAAPNPALAPYQPPPVPSVTEWPREKLVGFMRELTDFVYAQHIVRDTNRPVYGMTYEFLRDGKPAQVFLLDAMHDGSWFMSAMITAQRSDPAGNYLERAQRYQIPFYVNMLNHSDQLFAEMKPTNEDKKPYAHPLKGWVPRGWDDGVGVDAHTGKPIPPGYATESNHLMQDLADSLLDVWMTTRDPAVAEALLNIYHWRPTGTPRLKRFRL